MDITKAEIQLLCTYHESQADFYLEGKTIREKSAEEVKETDTQKYEELCSQAHMFDQHEKQHRERAIAFVNYSKQ